MITRVFYGMQNGLYNYSKFVCDTESDIARLPTTVAKGNFGKGGAGDNVINQCCAGSQAIVISTKKLYMLDNNNVWNVIVDYSTGGGGGGGSFNLDDDGMGNVFVY